MSVETSPVQIRETLNRIRLDEGLTYAQLAEQIGLPDHSSLHRFLSGRIEPHDRTLHKMRLFLAGRDGVELRA